MIRRIFPYPLLTISLVVFWMTINSFSPGHLLLGIAVAMVASWAMASLRPPKPRIRNWHLVVKLCFIVFYDIIRSNLAVAFIILFNRDRKANAGFLTIPLDLRDPMGLAALAVVLTATPGSAWLEYNSSQGTLLIHVLDEVSEAHWQNLIKSRYEKLLMEIFE
ncbi:Na+/H+ antiporter subunit E [Agrobacterium vaccinii]|jgi:multicomponent K+:H+ antiporter subunit E|uniref:Na+/H+ antiporter subunit E n=1 Tax=Agrobacterium TaxID=357 RepID=UPI001E59D6A0|nr:MULTISPECIES: Na+/H+ antiporter subunit E [Agrobacterium]UHS60312.1 Na+/H+ antiporter subunit E [Agrobacterium vaccinii]